MSGKFKTEDWKPILSIVGIVTAFLLICGLFPVLVDNAVVVSANVNYESWVADYQIIAFCLAAVVAASAIGWYAMGRWFFKIEYPENMGRRMYWISFFAIPVFVYVLICLLWDAQIQEGQGTIYSLLGLLTIGGYYISTVLFSAPACKYMPLGSQFFRGPRQVKMVEVTAK